MDTSSENPSELQIRYTDLEDAKYLKQWLMDDSSQDCFPMLDEIEVEDAVVRWIAFARYQCSLTVLLNGVPSGIATLFLQPYKRLSHQCEFGIIVDPQYRGLGIGTYLLSHVLHLAREKFKIKLIHLQVYENNPAINLYKRFGFKEFGRQMAWIQEKEGYSGRIFMEKMF